MKNTLSNVEISIRKPAEPLLVDKQQAARMLTISTRHVDALVARGLLPKVKLGSACRFRVADIMGMVDRLASGQVISKEDG
jgi:excisionase family DNA binding protein